MQYKNSRPFDVHRWSNYPQIDKDLMCELCRELKIKTKKQEKHLKVVVLDLWVAHNESKWVAYSRSIGDYKTKSRYNRLFIGYTALIEVIDKLVGGKYVDHKLGFKDRRSGIGFHSRMRATNKLVTLIKECKIDDAVITQYYGEEVIILKGEGKKKVEYDDDENTNEKRKTLTTINDKLCETIIDIELDDETLNKLEPIDFTSIKLKRVFNNNSFEEGGRFYNGWWQGVPKKYRGKITIDGNKTIELDYSGLHFRMLYAMRGLDPPKDPYKVKGVRLDRGKIKKITNILLNANSLSSAKRAIKKAYPTLKSDPIPNILKTHKVIRKYFHTGVGLKLQYWDSVIAERVLLKMKDNVVLPIHDSFIVEEGKVKELEKAMKDSFNEIYPEVEALIKRSDGKEEDSEPRDVCYSYRTENGYIVSGIYNPTPLDYEDNPKALKRKKFLTTLAAEYKSLRLKREVDAKNAKEQVYKTE